MRKLYRCFFTQNNLLILLFGLFAVVCFGQNKQAVECKEKEYFCKIINYSERINSVCKANDIDCHIAEYAKIVESNPNDPAAYFIRGTAYRNHFYKIKDPDRTILDFKKILELDPQYRS
ncbi:MAG TPA: hypothetical protein PKY59_22500, partial [Pyrinomonadaceae bacterium]|nr:hypothetical protein [Pyrinomonadaceae bacterium]